MLTKGAFFSSWGTVVPLAHQTYKLGDTRGLTGVHAAGTCPETIPPPPNKSSDFSSKGHRIFMVHKMMVYKCLSLLSLQNTYLFKIYIYFIF